MPWKPSFEGERPTLGFLVLDWIAENLAQPGVVDYRPLVFTREQAEFTLALYELDPITGKRIIRRGVLSRSRGWGKSPLLAALSIAEGLADVVPDGWDAEGQPVGRPWATLRYPLIQVAAASEAQTKNAWRPLLQMLETDAPVLDNYPGLEPLGTFVNLPFGRIEPITTSATSAKGNQPVWVHADQTEQWTHGNGAVNVFKVIRANINKTGGTLVETPNAYIPGVDSQAERTAKTFWDIDSGRNKRLREGVLYDHREAPPETDLTDRESIIAGMRLAYGDSSDHADGCVLHDPPCAPGWSPIESAVGIFFESDADEQELRSDWLNQITHASDSWLSGPEVQGIADAKKVVADGDTIVLGFDGSRGRVKGKPDATALIGCRVEDGHLFELGIWEADDRDKNSWETWAPPIPEIEATLALAFEKYRVVGFYADPGRDWRSHVNAWEAKYGAKVKIKGRRDHPFEWWMTGGRSGLVQVAVEALEGAIRNQDCTFDGSSLFTLHLLNARRRLSHGKLALGKANDYSPRKIDAAVAAVLAWQARLDALAAGHGKPRSKQPRKVRRLR